MVNNFQVDIKRAHTVSHQQTVLLNVMPLTRCKNEKNLHNSSDFDVKQHLQEANLTLAGKAHELYSEKH